MGPSSSALKQPLADKVVLGHRNSRHLRRPFLHQQQRPQVQGQEQNLPRQRPAARWAACSSRWDTATPEGWHQRRQAQRHGCTRSRPWTAISSSSSSSVPPSATAKPKSDVYPSRERVVQRQGEGGGVESAGGNNGADVAPGPRTTTAAAVETTVGAPAATAEEAAAPGPESTSDEPPRQSAGKGDDQDSDGFGEHGWYSPAGSAEVGVG